MLEHWAYHALTSPSNSLHEGCAAYIKRCASIMLERNLKNLNDWILIGYCSDKGLFFLETGVALEDLYPKRFFEKLERGFFNIVRAMPRSQFSKFRLTELKHDINCLLFSDDFNEIPSNLVSLMVNEGWLSQAKDGPYGLTVKGADRYEAKALAPDKSNAFLAMWFGVEGSDLYRDAVQKAVALAGYHLQIVDAEDYNGFIMDKVVNLINDSAFVIADISAAPELLDGKDVKNGVRGGVYWEAGYAAGQKKQVILTCSCDDDSIKRIHFDLEQYNQIRWRIRDERIVTLDGRDFEDALNQRIVATIGKGKNA